MSLDRQLLYAAGNGVMALVERALNRGASIHCKDKNGNTALHLAGSRGNEAMVKFLLQRGSDAEAVNNYGERPVLPISSSTRRRAGTASSSRRPSSYHQVNPSTLTPITPPTPPESIIPVLPPKEEPVTIEMNAHKLAVRERAMDVERAHQAVFDARLPGEKSIVVGSTVPTQRATDSIMRGPPSALAQHRLAPRTVRVKCHVFAQDIRVMTIDRDSVSTIPQLLDMLVDATYGSSGRLVLMYLDREGDHITLFADDELATMWQEYDWLYEQKGSRATLKLFVERRKKATPLARRPPSLMRLESDGTSGDSGDTATDSSSFADGDRWKMLQMGEMIGRGGFAEVFRAFDRKTGMIVAVKHVELDEFDQGVVQRVRALQEEVFVLEKLNHPNIVRFLGCRTLTGALQIILEYHHGSVSSMIRQYGALNDRLLRRYTRQIVLGLEYLHGRGVIHSDVKPGNILVNIEGHIKLSDFGCSRMFHSLSSQGYMKTGASEVMDGGPVRGTSWYLAPELLTGGHHGRAADIWALGCTIIEMASGTHPWSEVTQPAAMMFKLCSEKCGPELPKVLSEGARSFVRDCLQYEASDRPSASTLLMHPWLSKNLKKK